jgi:propionyl-CoA carboxylase alpha chain
MKMQNILRAKNDCVVAEVLAKAGDSLSVDQPILRFQ